jgi:Fe-S cluster biogenesis protein NfuA
VLLRIRSGEIYKMTEQEQGQATLTERVKDVIEQIRPPIQADGGDIELVDIDPAGGKVSIRFQGACRGCEDGRRKIYEGTGPRNIRSSSGGLKDRDLGLGIWDLAEAEVKTEVPILQANPVILPFFAFLFSP